LPAATPIIAIAADPIVASVLGAVLGVGMLALTAAGVSSFTPETLEIGMARAVVFMVLGLVVAFVALLLYFEFARRALVPFGLGLVGGFTVPATVALFRASAVSASSAARR